jgi:hypothetical protein
MIAEKDLRVRESMFTIDTAVRTRSPVVAVLSFVVATVVVVATAAALRSSASKAAHTLFTSRTVDSTPRRAEASHLVVAHHTKHVHYPLSELEPSEMVHGCLSCPLSSYLGASQGVIDIGRPPGIAGAGGNALDR